MAKSRAEELYWIGVEATAKGVPSKGCLTYPELWAMAHMVAAATEQQAPKPVKPVKPKAAPKPKVERPKLPFTPEQFYEAVLATDKVACLPYNSKWFGQLGKALHSMMPRLQVEDMAAFVVWLEDGGLDWMKEKPSFGTVISKLHDWLPRARAANGNQLSLNLEGCL